MTRMRALVVDDEPLIRMCTADFLAELGYDTLEAGSGDEAIGLLRLHRFELILTDHRMPGMTGRELAAFVAAAYPETTVIIASGACDADTPLASTRHLSKPFSFADLCRVLNARPDGRKP